MKAKTIDDIAFEAGVSKATVSRVLSHPEIVSEKTQAKVRLVMEKYSYMPSHLAQGLAGTATKTIGVVIDELSNFFFIEIAEGIDRILSSHGYTMLLCSSRWIEEQETQLVKSLISSRVDGVLLAPISEHSRSIEMLQESDIPLVILNCIPEDPNISFVTCDNREGGREAARYLNKTRKKQLIVITGFGHQTIEHRMEGLLEEIENPERLIRYKEVKTQEEGYDLVPTLLEKNHIDSIPTTLFVTNDNVAIGVINHLVELKIEIPGQVALLGYDNIRISALCRVPLTTISQSIPQIGELAAKSLLKLLKKKEQFPQQQLIQPKVVVRETG